ncbi:hypothetical protein [Actinospongicola halichondriae]|uniref:hypothetical protein n=1 Tax=Actinospongicola halichondriae TaxID=3236844 RepID=UPI003D5064EF
MTAPVVDRDPRWLRWAADVITVLIAAWALRILPGGELAPGNDITGHLQRSSFGLREVFGSGRFDAWYPSSMLGYQLFLFYGPGLTILIGLAHVVTFGLVSDAGALELVLVVAYVATPFATARLARGLGLQPIAAMAAGVLSLAAGSTRGGGIDGTFATGLAAQQVAMPLVVLALAMIVERVNRASTSNSRRGPLPLAFTVSALALTHPLSLLVLAMFIPVVLLAVWIQGTVDRRGWRVLFVAAVWTVGLSAWWWLPATVHSDLRGPVTSFTLPGVWEHIELLITGERGWRGIAGPIATLGVVSAVADAIVHRDRRVLSLALIPVSAFVLLHLAHGILGIDNDVGRQLPNRGLVFVAVLAAPAVAVNLEDWLSTTPERLRRRLPAVATSVALFAIIAAVTFRSVTTLEIGPVDRYRPIDDLQAAARILADDVPDSARFAWIDGGTNDLGVPEPQRWLAWKADRSSTTPFGPEYAPGSGTVSVASNGPPDEAVEPWIDDVRLLGATHIVTGNDEKAALLHGNERLRPLLESDSLSLWRIESRPDRPTGTLALTGRSQIVGYDLDTYDVMVERDSDGPVEFALGYSPSWHATVDGETVDVGRSIHGRVEIELGSGDHDVTLRFRESAAGPAGRAITGISVLAAAGWWIQRRRRTRSEPVAETGSKSPATARR